MLKKLLYYLAGFGVLAVIFYFWWQGSGMLFTSGNTGIYLALGRLSGLLAVYFVLLQFMTIGRARFLEGVFGFDRLTRFHHWVGTFLWGFIIVHPILIIMAYKADSGFFTQLWNFLTTNDDTLQAAIAAVLFTFIAVYSIIIAVKKMNFEWWYLTHLLVYLAIALAWGHQLEQGGDFLVSPVFMIFWYVLYTFVLGNLLFFRFVKPAWNMQQQHFVVDRVVPENPLITSVYIKGNDLARFQINAGQFMIFRFLDKQHWWQAHPFSLSIGPNNTCLRASIKNVGDFTATINSIKPGTKVWIEGPYGVFTAKRSKSNKILLIAGGIGITPIRSLIEELGKQGKEMILLYNNKSLAETAFKGELDQLSTLYSLLSTHYIMSDDPSWSGEKGRIDQAMISKLVPDAASREVYLCGPPPMMKAVVNTLMSLGVPKNKIYFEKFSL